jgi:predicted  nucleic acid-binding Zn-ribbon protein
VDSNYQLSTKEMNDLDVVKAIKNHMRVFDRKEEAEDYVVASLENRMSIIKNEILDCREQIRSYQKEFREIEKYLNAFQNIIKEREEEREL